jgi:hypothetical protein
LLNIFEKVSVMKIKKDLRYIFCAFNSELGVINRVQKTKISLKSLRGGRDVL